MVRRLGLVVVTLVAALTGLALTAANRWGVGDPGPCRDTVTGTVTGTAAACPAPGSPWWALLLGALLPAAAVLAVGAARRRRRDRDRDREPSPFAG